MNYLCFPLSNDVYKLTMKRDDSLLRVGSQARHLSAPSHVHWFVLYFFPLVLCSWNLNHKIILKDLEVNQNYFSCSCITSFWWENIKRRQYDDFLSKSSLFHYVVSMYSCGIVNIDFCKRWWDFLPGFSVWLHGATKQRHQHQP